MSEIPQPNNAIQELRAAMERIRAIREVGDMAIHSARYDNETTAINQEFLQNVFESLPVQLHPMSDSFQSGYFETVDPAELRIISHFGILLSLNKRPQYNYDVSSFTPALVIGEYTPPNDSGLTEILLAGPGQPYYQEGWHPSSTIKIHKTTVAADYWHPLRDKTLGSLARPYDDATIMGTHTEGTSTFIVDQKNAVSLGIAQIFADARADQKRFAKTLRQNSSVAPHELYLNGSRPKVRSLRSSDFDGFEVMTHLEYIVAAFGIGEQFDAIKAQREAQMPTHPAEQLFQLPGYRKAVEAGMPPPPIN